MRTRPPIKKKGCIHKGRNVIGVEFKAESIPSQGIRYTYTTEHGTWTVNHCFSAAQKVVWQLISPNDTRTEHKNLVGVASYIIDEIKRLKFLSYAQEIIVEDE
jgi:hypothetical protein